MSSLTDYLPQLTPVRIGEETFLAGQLRMDDVAYFQHQLELRQPHPYAVHRDRILSARGELREALLLKVLVEESTWPPTFTTPQHGEELLEFLRRVLGRYQPLDDDKLIEIGYRVIEHIHEWHTLERVAYNSTPRGELIRMMRTSPDEVDQGDTWGEILDRLARDYHMTPDQVGRLTVSQYFSLCYQGKRSPMPSRARGPETEEQMFARVAREAELLASLDKPVKPKRTRAKKPKKVEE